MKDINEKVARKNLLRESKEIDGDIVKGYDFNHGLDYGKIVEKVLFKLFNLKF